MLSLLSGTGSTGATQRLSGAEGVYLAAVSVQVAALVAAVAAAVAGVAPLLRVRALVLAAARVVGEAALAVAARVRPLASVTPPVHAQRAQLVEHHAADVTRVTASVRLAAGRVLGQALGRLECLVARRARVAK